MIIVAVLMVAEEVENGSSTRTPLLRLAATDSDV